MYLRCSDYLWSLLSPPYSHQSLFHLDQLFPNIHDFHYSFVTMGVYGIPGLELSTKALLGHQWEHDWSQWISLSLNLLKKLLSSEGEALWTWWFHCWVPKWKQSQKPAGANHSARRNSTNQLNWFSSRDERMSQHIQISKYSITYK